MGPIGVALGGYLVFAVVLWWHVWSTHPTNVTICGCNDPALFLWMLQWPAYALAHGHNPFFSSAMFHPGGINLLSNTSVLAVGVPLIPVTWLFGPVATLNVASTLVPALSALAMFWLLRRWRVWPPAAFIGGLVFGFSPFVVDNLAVAHLMTSTLLMLPLIVACLDELLVRQQRRPGPVGAVLAILVAVQFFLGTELLAILAVCAVVGVVLVVGYAAVRDSREVVRRAPHAARGLGIAACLALALLAYPLWFALKGPAHLSGLVWPTTRPGSGGISLAGVAHLVFQDPRPARLLGGYAGPPLPAAEYLGVGLLVVVAIGLLVWWRDVRLWFFGAMGLFSVVLSVGLGTGGWSPWHVLAKIPVLQNIEPARAVAVTTFCAAILLAIVVDRLYRSGDALIRRLHSVRSSRRGAPVARVASGTLALVAGAVAVVPLASSVAGNVPLTVEPVVLPRWFAFDAPHLPPGQVVLAYPPPFNGGQAMAWQAVDSLHFALATGGGPEAVPARAGRERQGFTVVDLASAFLARLPEGTTQNIRALRQAILGWGVTVVVVPDPATLVPRYGRQASTAWALGALTMALGRTPQFHDGAWVWTDVRSPGPRLVTSTEAFARCVSFGPEPARSGAPVGSGEPVGSGTSVGSGGPVGSGESVPDCVIAASKPST